MTQGYTSELVPVNTSDELSFRQLFGVLRRNLWLLLLVSALVGAAVYYIVGRQTPVYESSTSILASQTSSLPNSLGPAVFDAPQLPPGAAEQVIHSKQTVDRISELMRASQLPGDVQRSITKQLNDELNNDSYRLLILTALLDSQQRGIYSLKASASTPQSARMLSTLAAQALLEWDTRRAKQSVERARRNIQAQLAGVTSRLQTMPGNSLERPGLAAARDQLQLSLSQARVLEEGAAGTLSLLAEANTPVSPVAPKPLRSGIVAAVVAFAACLVLALIRDGLRR